MPKSRRNGNRRFLWDSIMVSLPAFTHKAQRPGKAPHFSNEGHYRELVPA
jgi:hypothetical protein